MRHPRAGAKSCQVPASRVPAVRCGAGSKEVTLLDYGAGNVRSVRNAIKALGYTIKDVEKPSDITAADRLIFPGVGAFGQAMKILKERGYTEALTDYIMADKPFLGICLGLQLLFDGSEESGGCTGLGIVPGTVGHFDRDMGLPVPHIGWNDLQVRACVYLCV
jgi:glutamine amidotransferase/cyclase